VVTGHSIAAPGVVTWRAAQAVREGVEVEVLRLPKASSRSQSAQLSVSLPLHLVHPVGRQQNESFSLFFGVAGRQASSRVKFNVLYFRSFVWDCIVW
jgi:hypothetical protein